MVYKDAVQLVTDGFGQKGRGDSGIHASGESQKDVFVSNLLSEFFDCSLRKGGHLPVTSAAADIHHKTAEHLFPFGGMLHLGMELDRVEFLCRIFHCSHRAVSRVRRDPEALRDPGYIVRVAHPADGRTDCSFRIFIACINSDHILKEQGIRRIDHHLCPAVLADRCRLHCFRIGRIAGLCILIHRGAARFGILFSMTAIHSVGCAAAISHELGAVADAQNRDPHLKKLRGAGG